MQSIVALGLLGLNIKNFKFASYTRVDVVYVM